MRCCTRDKSDPLTCPGSTPSSTGSSATSSPSRTRAASRAPPRSCTSCSRRCRPRSGAWSSSSAAPSPCGPRSRSSSPRRARCWWRERAPWSTPPHTRSSGSGSRPRGGRAGSRSGSRRPQAGSGRARHPPHVRGWRPQRGDRHHRARLLGSVGRPRRRRRPGRLHLRPDACRGAGIARAPRGVPPPRGGAPSTPFATRATVTPADVRELPWLRVPAPRGRGPTSGSRAPAARPRRAEIRTADEWVTAIESGRGHAFTMPSVMRNFATARVAVVPVAGCLRRRSCWPGGPRTRTRLCRELVATALEVAAAATGASAGRVPGTTAGRAGNDGASRGGVYIEGT